MPDLTNSHRNTILFLLLFTPLISAGQKYSSFVVRGNTFETDSLHQEVPLDAVEITIINLLQDTITHLTDGAGEYRFVLPYEGFYILEYYKEGFNRKSILVDTRNIPENSAAEGFQNEIDIILTPEQRTAREEPIAIAEYNFLKNKIVFSKIDDFEKMERKIERWRQKAEKEKVNITE